jgi:hypothetical protein
MGSQRRFGFEPDRVTIREGEAGVIRELTRRFLAGEEPAVLTAHLNDVLQVPTSSGNPWDTTALLDLLTREINCGRVTFTDSKTRVKSVVGRMAGEPIVSEEDFDRVCAIVASRRRGRPNSPHYLCSSFAVCGQAGCGHVLHGRARNDLKPYPDGSVSRSYWCNRSAGGCGKTEIDQRALDAAIPALVIEILADPGNAGEIETAAREIASEATRLDLEIAGAEEVAEALADRLGRGEITLVRYDVAIKPVDERIARLKAERAALPEPESSPAVQSPETSREQWTQRWDKAGHKEKRDLLKMALRGRHLVVQPALRGRGSAAPEDVMGRVSVSQG